MPGATARQERQPIRLATPVAAALDHAVRVCLGDAVLGQPAGPFLVVRKKESFTVPVNPSRLQGGSCQPL
jgi:hypothetical protein